MSETKSAFIVAIDGPAASGKGTLARRIAERFGFAHLDTGMLYRAVGAKVLDAAGEAGLGDPQIASFAARALAKHDFNRPNLRSSEVSKAASRVAALGQVRAELLAYQRNFASRPPGDACGAVLDGRDIGTVICPDADVKLFVTASAEERARRRCAELHGQGADVSYEAVLEDVRARDLRDSQRAEAPLRQAVDALLLDTTQLDIDESVAQAAAIIERVRSI